MSDTLRIAVAMQKGGVGKTTTSINLAAALATRGHDVLAVDSDPQGAMSVKLGLDEAYVGRDHSLYDALADDGELDRDELRDLIIPADEIPAGEGHRPKQFDILPSHMRNFRLEKGLVLARKSEERLRSAFDRSKIDDGYDYVIVDTPPNLGLLADGALLACENVLFPAHANTIGRHSLELLFEEIDTLEKEFVEYDIRAIAGVLNELSSGSVSDQMRRWFEQSIGEENIYGVPDRAAVEHSIAYNSSVFGYAPEAGDYPWDDGPISEVRDTYISLAHHVEDYA